MPDPHRASIRCDRYFGYFGLPLINASDTIISVHRRHFRHSLGQPKGSVIMASRALKIDPAKSEERSVTSESVQAAVSDNIEREIAILAYQFWQERGSPIGSDQEDWFRAEREIARSTRKDEEVDEEEVGSPNSAEQSMAHAEETDSTMLRFPVRSEVIQASKRTTHGFR